MEDRNYNLLIVDDEYLEIEILRSQFDFSACGISSVLEAHSGAEAKELLASSDISIILCDIEMPGESGLELLYWIREHNYEMECIFLTNYAEFEYARKAVELNSVDYLLKPVDFSLLEKSILRAKERIQSRESTHQAKTFSNLWLQHQRLIAERFWRDVIIMDVTPTKEGVEAAAMRLNLPDVDKMYVLPIVIEIQKWLKALPPSDLQMMVFSLRQIADGVLYDSPTSGIIFEYERSLLVALIYFWEKDPRFPREAKKRCDRLVEQGREDTYCSLRCYVGEICRPYELPDMVEQLIDIKNAYVDSTRQVVFSRDINMSDYTIPFSPDMGTWEALIKRGQQEQIVKTVRKYYEDVHRKGPLSSESLLGFRTDFLQIIASYCHKQGIKFSKLFSEKLNETTLKRKLEIEELIEWTENILKALKSYEGAEKEKNDIIEEIKKYIERNIGQKITRKDIADSVFLNPDYLTKLFKEKTGVKLSDYILKQRMELAQKLLADTDLSITEIAIECGYENNIAYFSHVFKLNAQDSPLQYRVKHRNI